MKKIKLEKAINDMNLKEALRTFCIDNADSIIGCGWYNTRHCLKNCKFYHQTMEKYAKKKNRRT